MELDSLIPLLTLAVSFVSISFLSKKDKINRRDLIVEKSIKIKQDMEDLILQIQGLISSFDEEHLNQKIFEFWKKLDEIGFLYSKATLLNKDIIQVFFNYFYGKTKTQSQDLIISLYIIYLYGDCSVDSINKFAKERLAFNNVDKITSLDDIDTRILGDFIKTEYPYIWHFVWQFYEKNFFYRLCKTAWIILSALGKGALEVAQEMVKPMLGSIFAYLFIRVLQVLLM